MEKLVRYFNTLPSARMYMHVSTCIYMMYTYVYVRGISIRALSCLSARGLIIRLLFQEDILATDELFLNYFNEFLALPVSEPIV